MSDSYIKLSQIALSSLENLLPNDNQVSLPGLSDNGELSDLNQTARFVQYKNTLSPDCIALTLLPDINTVSFGYHISQVAETETRKLYVETNNKVFRYLDINSAEEDINAQFTIYEGNQAINSLIFSPVVLDSSGMIIQNKDLIKSFTSRNQNITSLELNLPSCSELTVYETNLCYLNLAPEMRFTYLDIRDSLITGTFEINLNSQIQNINLSNNVIQTLIINGDHTILNTSNTDFLTQKANRLSYVKFNNCSVEDDLQDALNNGGIQYDIE